MGLVAMTRPLPRALRGLTRVDALDDCILALEPRTGIPLGMAALTGTRGRTAHSWVMVRRSSRRRGVALGATLWAVARGGLLPAVPVRSAA